MRKLQTKDVFILSRIMKQANIKQTISDIVKAKKDKAGAEEIGIDIIMTVIEACADEKLETMVYELLAGIVEKSVEDVMSQSIETTIEQVTQVIKENNIKNFFNTASRLTT